MGTSHLPRRGHTDFSSGNHPAMTLQLQAIEAGFFLVDCGTTATKLGNPRYILSRASDKAVFHYATAKQVRECLKGNA